MAFKQDEIATVTAGGQVYSFWQSISMERTIGEAVSHCVLEVAEFSQANSWQSLKLGPGDQATVLLAGQAVLSGFVDLRQAAYRKDQHAVQIRISSLAQSLTASTVNASPGQYTNSTFQQIAKKIGSEIGININVVGSPSGADTPFRRISEPAGQFRIDFLSDLARMVNLFVCDDLQGNVNWFRADSGASTASPVAQLIEGKNILEARCIMQNDQLVSKVDFVGADYGDNDHWGGQVRDVKGSSPNANYKGPNRPYKITGEVPGLQTFAQMRADHEKNIQNLQSFEMTVTVQGWCMDDGRPWVLLLDNNPVVPITVYSPMLMPTGVDTVTLYLKSVKHLQDSYLGTRTELNLCLQSGLGGTDLAAPTDNS